MNRLPPTSNWVVFKLLWKTARRRSVGRRMRQQAILYQKKGSVSPPLAGLLSVFMILIVGVIHAALGWMLVNSLETAQIVDAESGGKMVVADHMRNDLEKLSESSASNQAIEEFADDTASWRKRELGGSEEVQKLLVESHFKRYGAQGFVLEEAVTDDSNFRPAAYWPVAGFIFLWWLVMIIFQGEGLELDIQRRRYPMWEWVQSHPIRPVAAFTADLLAPLMTNPVYFTAPIFWWIVLWKNFGVFPGLVGGILIGLPFAVAASSLNKALEIAALLRLSPRNRGAVLGLMSWLGYAAMMLPLLSMSSSGLMMAVVRFLAPLANWLPLWPVKALSVGWDETPVWEQVVISGVLLAAVMISVAVTIAWWGGKEGLQATSGASSPVVQSPRSGSGLLAKYPLYRKELLWFWRDKGAVVQAILIPLTIAGFQIFNLRGLLDKAVGSWNGVCAAAIICGTYFLLVLGPRSLASEGGALWIATTWPHGMEELLKAKARLWWFLSSVIVAFVLIVAMVLFPADWWRICLVATCWYFFGRSLAEKSVTLATAPSSSGEPEPASKGRQWSAMLGTFTFSAGVITGYWSIAIMGVVFSSLASAAMWQNFRARLPFLFDPWSEKLPPAPSLMHAMIGIAAMVEIIGITTAAVVGFGGQEHLWLARAVVYGLIGTIAWGIMQKFLKGRGVTAASIWHWSLEKSRTPAAVAYGAAVIAGAVLGGLALLYLMGLREISITRELVVAMDQMASGNESQRVWILLLTVGLVPFAEEYFFRGLLYRALDREWGGWRAMVASAAYFAIYHPPLSWLPVFALGICCAWLFKKNGRLGPCVLMHMIYNLIVVGVT